MTDDIAPKKRPKRWLAFLLNLIFPPAGYVYAGRTAYAVVYAVIILIAGIGLVIWTFLSPPGIYALGFRDGAIISEPWHFGLLIGVLVAIHAALCARPRRFGVLASLGIALGLYALVIGAAAGWRVLGPYKPYSVPSGSMIPTLQVGDVFLAKKAKDCVIPSLKAGQVVTLRLNGTIFVRRLIAGPGQTVEMDDGRLIIDGVPVKTEPAGRRPTDDLLRETLPNGSTYLTMDMGPGSLGDDHPPLKVPADHWYSLGDNRDNSMDSRFDGPSPATAICGRVVKILYSHDKAAVGRRLD